MTLNREDALVLDQLEVAYTDKNGCFEVLDKLSFSIADKSYVSIVGPSGGGKSTLLRAIAGLIPHQQGVIRFPLAQNGKANIGVVFQKANLLPWRTLEANIALPLDLSSVSKEDRSDKLCKMIQLVGLEGFEQSYPHELSGGMAQRVSIARALIQDPDILLLDEPFGQLDALTRERMGEELLRIWDERKKTVLMVTHSISEALYLSDRVLVLSNRPAQISYDLSVPLPRPRHKEMRFEREFAELSQLLHGELEKYTPDS